MSNRELTGANTVVACRVWSKANPQPIAVFLARKVVTTLEPTLAGFPSTLFEGRPTLDPLSPLALSLRHEGAAVGLSAPTVFTVGAMATDPRALLDTTPLTSELFRLPPAPLRRSRVGQATGTSKAGTLGHTLRKEQLRFLQLRLSCMRTSAVSEPAFEHTPSVGQTTDRATTCTAPQPLAR